MPFSMACLQAATMSGTQVFISSIRVLALKRNMPLFQQ